MTAGRSPALNRPSGAPVERLNGGEPIITPTANWWETGVTFNAAAIYLARTPENEDTIHGLLPMLPPDDPRMAEGVVAVLYRARPENDPGSAFGRSFIGMALFTPHLAPLYRWQEPVLAPSPEPGAVDGLGVEDPRITLLDGLYTMVYCGVQALPEGGWKASLCQAISTDMLHWEKLGVMAGDIDTLNNKDGVLFPEPIDGQYYLLHRPFDERMPRADISIHIAQSDSPSGPWRDLGEVLRAFPNPRMASSWVGAGSVPIWLDTQRYLVIYHTGNYLNPQDREYDLDAAAFDFSDFDPAHPAGLVRARLEPLMVPETPAELRSRSHLQVGNVLFACGSYEYRGWIYIIYGGADTYTLAARVEKRALLEHLRAAGLKNPFLRSDT